MPTTEHQELIDNCRQLLQSWHQIESEMQVQLEADRKEGYDLTVRMQEIVTESIKGCAAGLERIIPRA